MKFRRPIVVPAVLVAAALAAPAQASAALRPGDIVVADLNAFAQGGLIKIDPATGKQTLLSSSDQPVNLGSTELIDDPYDVTVTPSGAILVADEYAFGGTGGVVGVNPDTGKQTRISSNDQPVNMGVTELFLDPWGVAFAPGLGIVVSDYNAPGGGDGRLIGVDRASGKQRVLSSDELPVNQGVSELFEQPSRVAVDPTGDLLVADGGAFGGTGGVIGVNREDGRETEISSNQQAVSSGSSELFAAPVGIDLLADGSVVVVDSSAFGGAGGVIGVDPGTGKQTKVAANDQPVNAASMIFDGPYGIATAIDGDLFVVEPSAPPAFGGAGGAVIRVDTSSGQQALLSSNDQPVNAGSSEFLTDPYGIAVVPPKCTDLFATLFDVPGVDRIDGSPFADVIATAAGADRVNGAGGADRLCSGMGADRLVGGKGKDLLIGGKGKDLLIGGKGRDRLNGGRGRDVCVGGKGRDRAKGCEVRRSI